MVRGHVHNDKKLQKQRNKDALFTHTLERPFALPSMYYVYNKVPTLWEPGKTPRAIMPDETVQQVLAQERAHGHVLATCPTVRSSSACNRKGTPPCAAPRAKGKSKDKMVGDDMTPRPFLGGAMGAGPSGMQVASHVLVGGVRNTRGSDAASCIAPTHGGMHADNAQRTCPPSTCIFL